MGGGGGGVCERLLLKSSLALTVETSVPWFPWISLKEITAGCSFGDQSCHENTQELFPMKLGRAGRLQASCSRAACELQGCP